MSQTLKPVNESKNNIDTINILIKCDPVKEEDESIYESAQDLRKHSIQCEPIEVATKNIQTQEVVLESTQIQTEQTENKMNNVQAVLTSKVRFKDDLNDIKGESLENT